MKNGLVILLFVVTMLALSAMADDTLIQFKGGIGVIPISNVVVAANGTVTVSRNNVRGVLAAGQIWVIADLSAEIKLDGRIRVDGRGLLLGGGDNIGRENNRVFATVICEPVAPFTERNTTLTGVELVNGDFRIDDVLTPAPPADCASPVLLIRNAANRNWFAAGIPKHD